MSGWIDTLVLLAMPVWLVVANVIDSRRLTARMNAIRDQAERREGAR